MLKSYDFFEISHIEKGIKDKGIFDEEIQIIKEMADGFPKEEKASFCPACGGEITGFFQIWNRAYYKCLSCQTVFMNPHIENLIALNSDKKLIQFRKAEEYQRDIEEHRSLLWDDLVFWLKYRIFRYLGNLDKVSILDFSNRYNALAGRLSSISDKYELRETFINAKSINTAKIEEADAILYFDQIQRYKDPTSKLIKLKKDLKAGGLLFLSARIGTGLDILTMKDSITNILPYEHVTLLSIAGINAVLDMAGYDVLEITTPGVMDVKYLMDNYDKIPKDQDFIRFMIRQGDKNALSELQRFLQKNQLSSYAQIVARKRGLES